MPVAVLDGRRADPAADRAVLDDALAWTARTGRPTVRAWVPRPTVAFGRRDARHEGYDRARDRASARGYEPIERTVGGRAVAYTGGTVAVATTTPVPDAGGPDAAIARRYDDVLDRVETGLSSLGATVERGEPPGAFCPGSHSLRAAGGGKLAGVAQRVRADAALVAGCVLVADRAAQRAVLVPVYDALGVSLDPASVGDVARAGGPTAPERVAGALENALVGSAAVERLSVDDRDLAG